MNKQDAKKLIDRLDESGIMNPATYQLGLDDKPNKVRFMEDYTKQMNWITDAYAGLMSYWSESAANAMKSPLKDKKQ